MSLPRYPGSREHRGLSADLWRNLIDVFMSQDPVLGAKSEDDFNAAPVGWTVSAVNSGSNQALVQTTGFGGIGNLSATTGTDHMGAQAILGSASGGSYVVQNGQRLVCEALLYPNTDSDSFFVGLVEAGVTLWAADSTLADEGYIGFYRVNDGGLNFVCNNTGAGGAPESVEVISAATLAAAITAGDPVKVGFAVNADGTVDVCVDGYLDAETAAAIEFVNVPTETLAPRLIVARGADGDAATADISADWVKVAQEGTPDSIY